MPRPFEEADLTLEPLPAEPFVPVGAAQSRLTRRRQLTLADVLEAAWVLPGYDTTPGALIADSFRERRLAPPVPRVTTLSMRVTTYLLSTGRFVGILPDSLFRANAKCMGLALLPLKFPLRRLSAGVITVRYRTPSPLTERFLACVRDVCNGATDIRGGARTRASLRGRPRYVQL